jgi:hypothetical protein
MPGSIRVSVVIGIIIQASPVFGKPGEKGFLQASMMLALLLV